MGELLSNKDSVIVYLAAQGKTAKEISEATDISLSTIKSILDREHVQFEIGHLRHKLFGRDAKKRWKDMIPKAQDAVEKVLDNPNLTTRPGIQLHAAEIVLDRAEGKPKQTIDHQGSLVRDVFDMLREKKEKPVLDVTPIANDSDPEENQKPLNAVDEWAKKNL